jgi:uncharacterized protein YmfQ (DUF2313 family)
MSLEQTTALYAAVLRQLLPEGVYDTADSTHVADDIYAHAKALAQADIDAHRLLGVLEAIPIELLADYEREYGLPLKCTVNAGKTLEERIELLRWVRSTRNVLNRAYFNQVLKIFGVELFEFKKFRPMQCTAPCNAPVNTEQLRYKIRIVIPDTTPADMDCIIGNYFPGYLRIDLLKVPKLFRTSKPYPILHIEDVSTNFEVNNGFIKAPISAETENIFTSFSINSVSFRTPTNEVKTDSENLELGFVLDGIQVTKQVAYLSTTAEVESLKMGLTLDSIQITKTVNYLNTTMAAENIQTGFALNSVQITN